MKRVRDADWVLIFCVLCYFMIAMAKFIDHDFERNRTVCISVGTKDGYNEDIILELTYTAKMSIFDYIMLEENQTDKYVVYCMSHDLQQYWRREICDSLTKDEFIKDKNSKLFSACLDYLAYLDKPENVNHNHLFTIREINFKILR